MEDLARQQGDALVTIVENVAKRVATELLRGVGSLAEFADRLEEVENEVDNIEDKVDDRIDYAISYGALSEIVDEDKVEDLIQEAVRDLPDFDDFESRLDEIERRLDNASLDI